MSNDSTGRPQREEPSLMERLLMQLEEVNLPIAPDEEPEQESKPEDSQPQNTDEK